MPAPNTPGATIHATCIALGTAGVLIRGEAGAGKSTLALLLLDRADLIGIDAALVGDDRIGLTRDGAALVARPHPALKARIEIRGLGIFRTLVARDRIDVALVVDLVEASDRLPAPTPEQVAILGIQLSHLVLDGALLRSGLASRLVLDRLAGDTGVTFGTHQRILNLPPEPKP